MMKNKDSYIKKVINDFQNNHGKASLYCFTQSIIPELINTIIQNYRIRHINTIFIVVDKYETRKLILDYLTKNDNHNNVKILSKDYIKLHYHYIYNFTITVGVNDDYRVIKHLYDDSKFTLSILTKNIMDNNFITNIRNILPGIDNIDINIDIDKIYSPVEETYIPVDLSDDDLALYDKCDNYITTSCKIFGSLSNIEKCKKGDVENNISSAEFRNNLAIYNGWREDLDTTIEFQRQIDDVYNPNELYERACKFYDITRKRREIVSNNENKLQAILELCHNHSGKKILIISKNGEFANKIADYINKNSYYYCGCYHDCIEDKILIDENTGEPIVYKSGINKGKPRIVGSQYQSNANEKVFANGCMNILSIKNSSNPKLSVACDVVIITTPFCDDIINIKRRFSKLNITTSPNKIYMLYSTNTIERILLNKDKKYNNVNIIDNNKNNIEYDENSGDVIL